ncbi:MAG: type II toxin-antitoxin system death-on-curing family toxin [Nitrospirae bacterium]|nr:type II toxin-antitoxin system death-on-curing family toxin [Nitrospirota bacterium]
MTQKNKNISPKHGKIVIYTTDNKEARLDVKLEQDTVWLSQKQLAELFKTERSVITKHVNNVFKNRELEENSVCAIFAHTAADGKIYKTKYYNLDVIISVGYRVNSRRATQFRIWATKVLKEHIVKGFSLNEKRLTEQQQTRLKELEKAVALLQKTAHNVLTREEAVGLLAIITGYAKSWILLQQYDNKNINLISKGVSKPAGHIKYAEAQKAIESLKKDLIDKKEASELFGIEREKGLESILSTIYQTFGGKELYPGIEEKAAHLLYFIIKDHPFIDGNKRIGSFLFILFLHKNNYLLKSTGEAKINDNTLVAIALLIAESKPKEKETMTALITNLLNEY